MTSLPLLALAAFGCQNVPQKTMDPQTLAPTVYGFKTKDIDGKPVELKKFEGKVLLVVNVASQCGLTPQYKGLQALYAKYKDQGLVVVGFPANDFGNQEPGSEGEIKKFCETTFGVTFPMMEKTVVKGEAKSPLFAWLIEKSGQKTGKRDEIEWNFGKFLVGRDGTSVERFSPRQTAESPEVVAAVEKALAAKG